ncbi:MAG TPA: NAD+ synthase, partial [Parasegetibacter sp.]
KKLAVTICEDLWNLEDDPLYRICPMDELIKHAPDIMINLSASPFDYDHDDARKVIIRNNVLRYRLPMIYCNSVGAQTEIVFDGGSLVYNAEAELIQELKYFEEDQTTVYFNEDGTITSNDPSSEYSNTSPVADSAVPDTSVRLMNRKSGETSSDSITSATPDKLNPAADLLHFITARENMVQIRQAIVLGIKDYFRKMGFTKAILGSSGGIDSAVTLVLACEALGHTNVRAVLMPSSFSTNHSVSDAEQLSLNLQNPYDIIPIAGLFDAFSTSLKPVFGDLPFDVAEENLQSRIRGNLLMAVSNKFGNILLNTSNKSELATGYGTLYGDMAGGLSILGDLYKSQVYALARLINEEKEIIPNHILIKPPSAELRPGQKDSDSLPDYDVLDQILFLHIEKRLGPSAITNAGFDEAIVKKTLRLVNNNEYKRKQFAPIIRVSSKAFGAGRRMPVVGKYLNFNR